MFRLGCWKVHGIFRTVIYICAFLLYGPDFVILAARCDTTSCTIESFYEDDSQFGGRFRVRSPVPGLRRRILIPERPERHRATRPNYGGIYEPLRRAPGKISNLDIYLLRPRASQTGPSSAARLSRERIFSSVATPRGERSSLKLFLDHRRSFSSLFVVGEFQRATGSGARAWRRATPILC